MSRRFTVTLAAAFALLAVVSCLAYGEEVRAEGERERQESLERYGGEVVGLVVATESLEAGDIVTTSNAEMRDWVSDLVPEGAMTSLDGVVGRRLTEPVAAGAPLCELNFRENESSLDIPSGKVALSIPVSDKLGVTRDVSAGDRLIAYRISDNSVSLLSGDVQVLLAPESMTNLTQASAMTVALDPADLPEVLTASTEGTLRLAVPSDDLSLEGVQGTTAPTSVSPTEESQDAATSDAAGANAQEGEGEAQ